VNKARENKVETVRDQPVHLHVQNNPATTEDRIQTDSVMLKKSTPSTAAKSKVR
jgi:hypothetical protein